MKLSALLKNIEVLASEGYRDTDVSSLWIDSRAVTPEGVFFAVPGTLTDGHSFIASAIANGAIVVICEQMPEILVENVTYIQVSDSAKAVGFAASEFYGTPSSRLKLVGITGTNGKTTTATLLYDMFRSLGYHAGLISTVSYRIGEHTVDSTHTTPDAIRLNAMLSEMVEEGCDYCFMEVSSHSIAQKRIAGLTFAGGVFTNLTHDHLDYHGTFAEYLKTKKHLFDELPKEAFALVNIDDRNGRVMVQNTRACVSTLSIQGFADFMGRVVEMMFDGMLLNIDSREVWVRFIGRFNAYNLLTVYTTALLLGADKQEVLFELSKLGAVNGRFEYIRSANDITAIVDYAHTPDALLNVVNTINEIRTPGQKLFVVVGCGGNRDVTKRPIMAHIAASKSDMAILTSDNPRLENPNDILAQMKGGIRQGDRYISICDRHEAIRSAVMMAKQGDIILVAGKGHETYQDIAGVKSHFDDKEEIRQAFTENGQL